MKYDELVFKICAHNHLDLALDHLFWLGCLVGLGGIFNLDWLISALVSLRLFSGIISVGQVCVSVNSMQISLCFVPSRLVVYWVWSGP